MAVAEEKGAGVATAAKDEAIAVQIMEVVDMWASAGGVGEVEVMVAAGGIVIVEAAVERLGILNGPYY